MKENFCAGITFVEQNSRPKISNLIYAWAVPVSFLKLTAFAFKLLLFYTNI